MITPETMIEKLNTATIKTEGSAPVHWNGKFILEFEMVEIRYLIEVLSKQVENLPKPVKTVYELNDDVDILKG
jgi:hypothetical protein